MEKKWDAVILLAVTLLSVAVVIIYIALDHRQEEGKEPRIALALSGGGYRATLHGLAALRALNDLGLLDRVEILSGVSGGSIAASYLAYYQALNDGSQFEFDEFEKDLLYAISTYEIPRTVLTSEILTSGGQATSVLSRCTLEELKKRLFGEENWGLENWQKAMLTCARETSSQLESGSIWNAVSGFAGNDCPRTTARQEQMEACRQGEEESMSATLTTSLLAAALGEDTRTEVRSMYCALKSRICAIADSMNPVPTAGQGRPDSGHPFADILHVTLFHPWHDRQGVVRMKDLDDVGFLLLINATSNIYGDLWTASQLGAGVRVRVNHSMAESWQPYRASRGPALADAVAASACYPLFCRPLKLPFPPAAVEEPLTDGGVHDNLGIEAIRQARDKTGRKFDLLVVADAHRPFGGSDIETSRFGTVLRIHDLLIDQRSAATIRDAKRWTNTEGLCDVVHVSLAHPDLNGAPLSGLPTDLRPIPNAAEIIVDAVDRFRNELQRNSCVRRWSAERTDGLR